MRFGRILSRLAAGALFAATPAAANPLADYAWSARPFLLFADRADDPLLRSQREILEPHRAALLERKVPVILIVSDQVELDGAPSALSAEALRRAYDAPSGAFRAVLIGKDTGVKLRQPRPVSADALFGLIDAMPMRRREMLRDLRVQDDRRGRASWTR